MMYSPCLHEYTENIRAANIRHKLPLPDAVKVHAAYLEFSAGCRMPHELTIMRSRTCPAYGDFAGFRHTILQMPFYIRKR